MFKYGRNRYTVTEELNTRLPLLRFIQAEIRRTADRLQIIAVSFFSPVVRTLFLAKTKLQTIMICVFGGQTTQLWSHSLKDVVCINW